MQGVHCLRFVCSFLTEVRTQNKTSDEIFKLPYNVKKPFCIWQMSLKVCNTSKSMADPTERQGHSILGWISFTFNEFLGKIGQIIRYRPHFGGQHQSLDSCGILDPPQ